MLMPNPKTLTLQLSGGPRCAKQAIKLPSVTTAKEAERRRLMMMHERRGWKI